MSTVVAPARTSWWDGVGSPGLVGYVAVYGVSAVVVAAECALLLVLADTVAIAGVALVAGTFLALLVGAPAALVGCTVVHLLLREVASQAAHVAAFAVAGTVIGGVLVLLVAHDEPGLLWFAPMLALATGTGRLSVLHLVHRRRTP